MEKDSRGVRNGGGRSDPTLQPGGDLEIKISPIKSSRRKTRLFPFSGWAFLVDGFPPVKRHEERLASAAGA